MTFSTADLCDDHPDLVGTCEPIFRSYGAMERFSGPVQTVRVHEDNVLLERALSEVAPGTVLVVDGGGSERCALLGDRLAATAASRGLAGLVIHGCVRDTAELAGIEIGILALASHPRKSRKDGAGERDVSVEFGGLRWSPGEHVYADTDGVILTPCNLLSAP